MRRRVLVLAFAVTASAAGQSEASPIWVTFGGTFTEHQMTGVVIPVSAPLSFEFTAMMDFDLAPTLSIYAGSQSFDTRFEASAWTTAVTDELRETLGTDETLTPATRDGEFLRGISTNPRALGPVSFFSLLNTETMTDGVSTYRSGRELHGFGAYSVLDPVMFLSEAYALGTSFVVIDSVSRFPIEGGQGFGNRYISWDTRITGISDTAPAAVPEPSTFVLMLLGLGAISVSYRSRRTQ